MGYLTWSYNTVFSFELFLEVRAEMLKNFDGFLVETMSPFRQKLRCMVLQFLDPKIIIMIFVEYWVCNI